MPVAPCLSACPPCLSPFGLTAEAFALATTGWPGGRERAFAVYRESWRQGCLPAGLEGAWRIGLGEALPTVEETREESGPEGVTIKAVVRLHDGQRVEMVRIPAYRETTSTLCLSSQVGCRLGCAFCATGRLGFVRDLTAAEIVGQVVVARRLGWHPRNLVFMGMGEPLDNIESLTAALHILTDPRGLHLGRERLTVCTAGLPAGLTRLAELGWRRLNLSISLNAADDVTRARLMPIGRSVPLATLQAALAAYPKRRNFALGVNWCLLPGLNDRPEDVRQLAAFCAPLGRVMVNVIPYNPDGQALTRAPEPTEIERFCAEVAAAGLPVRCRSPRGRGILAACGQLGGTPPDPAPASAEA